ncbi:hypothetical protein GCM10010116_37120 [Microbispora rosea subsp. aerata]|nr:hypothetical protein [Microbispora rosea]GGO18403.1 hypothetical protein GCM10010116_37120 [Microbispora rosea subsp. aerata]GIH56653.1 hypothetical protein Mro02_35670 [Microbispora rosea subsp. aerata]
MVFGLGALLRLVAVLGYRPALWFPDSYTYVVTAMRPRPDLVRPAGYSMFLRLLEPFHSFALVVTVQHVLGLLVGVMLYTTVLRRGGPTWAAVLACVPVLLDAYQIELEHLLVSDSLFTFLVVGAVCLALRRPRPSGTLTPRSAAALGLVLAAATLTRTVGLPLIAVFALFLLAYGVRRASGAAQPGGAERSDEAALPGGATRRDEAARAGQGAQPGRVAWARRGLRLGRTTRADRAARPDEVQFGGAALPGEAVRPDEAALPGGATRRDEAARAGQGAQPGRVAWARRGLRLGRRALGLSRAARSGGTLRPGRVVARLTVPFLVAAFLPVVGYAGWFYATHQRVGLVGSNGVFLYARTMSFADCSIMKPPADLAVLCDSRPPASRPVSQEYIWNTESPLVRLPGITFTKETDTLAGRFASLAIRSQPLDYLRSMLTELGRSFTPGRPVYPDAETYGYYKFPETEPPPPGRHPAVVGKMFAQRYEQGPITVRVVEPFAGLMRAYQNVAWLPGAALLVILLVPPIAWTVRWFTKWTSRTPRTSRNTGTPRPRHRVGQVGSEARCGSRTEPEAQHGGQAVSEAWRGGQAGFEGQRDGKAGAEVRRNDRAGYEARGGSQTEPKGQRYGLAKAEAWRGSQAGAGVVASPAGGWGIAWATAWALLVVPPATAQFDYRYVLPAVPLACLAAALSVRGFRRRDRPA